jgi:hypothetical protein
MATCADGSGSDGIVTSQDAANLRMPTAANDNRPGDEAFTFSSSIGGDDGAGATSDRSGSRRAARNLRPTDLFNDLAEDDGAFRAPVPLCATRGRVRPGK